MVTSPSALGGSLQGSADTSQTVLLSFFCCVEITFWGSSLRGPRVQGLCLLNRHRLEAPVRTPVPWEWAGLCPQWTLVIPSPACASGQVSKGVRLRVPLMEKISGSEAKGQGPDKVQVQGAGHTTGESCSHSDRGPPTSTTTLGFLLSPWPPARAPRLVGSDVQGIRARPGERPWGTAGGPTTHPPPSRARPPGRGPQCGFVWQLARYTGCMSGVALASRRCQPEGQRYQARREGVSCSVLQGPRPGTGPKIHLGWASLLSLTPRSWDPRAGGQGVKVAGPGVGNHSRSLVISPTTGRACRALHHQASSACLGAPDRASWS